MSGRLRELAEREGLPFRVAQETLSRLVVEAWEEQVREKNRKAAEAPEVEAPREPAEIQALVVAIDSQREKPGRYRRRCETCRGPFSASRRHARFCSVACRVRACRKRSAA